MAPWLLDAIQVIDTHRQMLKSRNVDLQDPAMKRLDLAEMLASFLADIDARRRPQLNIDDEGEPSFATALDDFYINLTVDGPDLITWYANVKGADHFNERVAFDGRKIPTALKALFAL
jgi:hypothetical protein